MLSWGPTLAHVSAQPRCTVSLAIYYKRPRSGCSGFPTVPSHPGFCLDRTETYNCVIDRFGGYACPTNADSAHTPLRNGNAATDSRGVLRLEIPLKGTRATPPLVWQRRYPHTDGWIYPWTRVGKLRPGLTFVAKEDGSCYIGSEQTVATSAIRCRSGNSIIDPCFPQRSDWRHHRGAIAACPNDPGDPTFTRLVIS